MNAFAVTFIFMCIFAIIAVDWFREFGDGGDYTTIQRFGPEDARWALPPDGLDPNVASAQSAMTARGFHFGQEYFGTFSRSLYTLFQVLTGESWSEAVARPASKDTSPTGRRRRDDTPVLIRR